MDERCRRMVQTTAEWWQTQQKEERALGEREVKERAYPLTVSK